MGQDLSQALDILNHVGISRSHFDIPPALGLEILVEKAFSEEDSAGCRFQTERLAVTGDTA